MTAERSIAFVSDIHGNLPALEAVVAELGRRGPFDRIVAGGDYATGGLYPEECVALVRDAGWDVVRGNADEWVVESATDGAIPAQGWVPEVIPDEATQEVIRWNVGQLSDDSVSFLSQLPVEWSTEGSGGDRLVFVHATPNSTHLGYPPDAPEEIFLPMFEQTGARVLLHGHIHHAYLRSIGHRLLGCIGSVGLPFDRDARACFAIADEVEGGWSVGHVRVPYDRESYVASVLASKMPNKDAYVSRVRNARQ